MMPPLTSQSAECFIPSIFHGSSPFAKDCHHFFDSLSFASADTVHPILESAVLTARPIRQGTKSILRLSYGQCQFTAIGLVEEAEGLSGKLNLTEWVQLWPTFTDSVQDLLAHCVGNNIGGQALLQYMSTFHVSKVKLLIENKLFQGYPTDLYDFAFDNYRAGAAGVPSSPVSSNSSFSRRPSSTANDYRLIDGFPVHPSRLQLPRVYVEQIREHICHGSQICRKRFEDFITTKAGFSFLVIAMHQTVSLSGMALAKALHEAYFEANG